MAVNELPRVLFQGEEWFMDLGLQQIRKVNNPHEWMTFATVDAICEDTGDELVLVSGQARVQTLNDTENSHE